MNNEDIFRVLIKMAVKQARTITNDQEALEVKILYPDFSSRIGKHLNVGEYVQYEDKLFKVIQEHDCQESWTPTDAPTLFQAVEPDHLGTLEDPIPARTNMIYENGKYYIENEVLYKCTRDSGIALQQLPSELVNVYFEIVE